MILGLSSYTYGWAVGGRGDGRSGSLDEHGLLDRVRQHGLNLLQVGDNLPLHQFAPERLERFIARAAREQVRLEIGARGLTLEHLATYAGLARQAGARLLRFVIDDGVGWHPGPDTITGILRDGLDLLEGLTLGLENHDRFPAATLRAIVESAASDRVGVCLDTANSLGAGEGLETVLSVLGPHTVNLHVKDFSVQRVPSRMGFTVEGRPAGQGLLDIAGLLGRFREFPRCATAALELWTPPAPLFAETLAREESWAGQSLEFLKPLFPSS